MTLNEKVNEDLKTALKAGEALKVSTLRMLKAAVSNAAIQKKKEALEDGELLEVIQKVLKQHQESVEAFTKGNRPELAQKEAQEAKVLQAYLPPAMDEGELTALIRETIRGLKVSGPSGLGQVMKAVLPKIKGRADGKTINRIVSQLLQGGG